jgi:hypothetical protein
MIGAFKIDSKSDDLKRLFQLFREGYNNSQISRMYLTNGGEKLSTEHIRQIRTGRRWNSQRYSFVEKHELQNQENIISKIGLDEFKTEIGVVYTSTLDLYVFVMYKNGIVQSDIVSPLMTKKPVINDLLEFHKKHIF